MTFCSESDTVVDMKKYISHLSAACRWPIPYLGDIFGADYMNKYRNGQLVDFTVTGTRAEIKNVSTTNISGTHISGTDMSGADMSGAGMSGTDMSGTDIIGNITYIGHSCAIPHPRGAVVKADKEWVASPELVFLELAAKIDIHRLILLGLQMCSHPPGKPNSALTTKRKLQALIKKMPGFKGHVNAERAILYIENGSNSIMESLSYMILTLPHSLGGFGLSGASFNHEIVLDSEGRKHLKQKRCFVDLFYKRKNLAIEYDSFAHHSTPSEQGKGLQRSTTLWRQGIDVLQLSPIQIYKKESCTEFAQNLASRLEKRVRIRAKGFPAAHENLRSLLPSKT